MLRLSRKVNETVELGLDEEVLVRVRVMVIQEPDVWLLIEAPRHMQVLREEVADEVQ